jgi:hypothetical protein
MGLEIVSSNHLDVKQLEKDADQGEGHQTWKNPHPDRFG